jgi:hypothetical protein
MMSPIYGSSFERYFLKLTDIFRRRVAKNWMVLALGWVLQTGRKTTAGLIRGAGGIATKSFAAYYRFFGPIAGRPKSSGEPFKRWFSTESRMDRF